LNKARRTVGYHSFFYS